MMHPASRPRPGSNRALARLAVPTLAAVLALRLALLGFVGGRAPALEPAGRQVDVARQVKEPRGMGRPLGATISRQSDEELHQEIELAKKEIFLHRLKVFRKSQPKRKNKLQNQYKIAVIKTELRKRALEKEAQEAADEKARRIAEGLPEKPELLPMAEYESKEMAKTAFRAWSRNVHNTKTGRTQRSQVPSTKRHFSPASKKMEEEWFSEEAMAQVAAKRAEEKRGQWRRWTLPRLPEEMEDDEA